MQSDWFMNEQQQFAPLQVALSQVPPPPPLAGPAPVMATVDDPLFTDEPVAGPPVVLALMVPVVADMVPVVAVVVASVVASVPLVEVAPPSPQLYAALVAVVSSFDAQLTTRAKPTETDATVCQSFQVIAS